MIRRVDNQIITIVNKIKLPLQNVLFLSHIFSNGNKVTQSETQQIELIISLQNKNKISIYICSGVTEL